MCSDSRLQTASDTPTTSTPAAEHHAATQVLIRCISMHHNYIEMCLTCMAVRVL